MSDQGINTDNPDKIMNKISRKYLFKELREKCNRKSHIGQPIALIDIDGTLLDNWPRQLAIFQQILTERYPMLQSLPIESLPNVKGSSFYSILQLLRPLLPNDVDFEQLQMDYYEVFLSDRFLLLDKPMKNVRSFIHTLLYIGIDVYFLTGRSAQRMKAGTLAWFNHYIFPSHSRQKFPNYDFSTHIIMKPDEKLDDFIFKRRVFQHFSKINLDLVWLFIDNEAQMCNLARNDLPKTTVIQFISNQSDNTSYSGPKLTSWTSD